MIRDRMIKEMIKFSESIPDGSSDYHEFDMLLSRMERLGMKPPSRCNKLYVTYKNKDQLDILKQLQDDHQWEPEDED